MLLMDGIPPSRKCPPKLGYSRVVFLIVVKYTKLKVYHLDQFSVHSSIALRIFASLCSQSLDLFYLAKLKLCAH